MSNLRIKDLKEMSIDELEDLPPQYKGISKQLIQEKKNIYNINDISKMFRIEKMTIDEIKELQELFHKKELYWKSIKDDMPIHEFLDEMNTKYPYESDKEKRLERAKKISWERALFINEWLNKLNVNRKMLPRRVFRGLF